jgi:hypothetical protein
MGEVWLGAAVGARVLGVLELRRVDPGRDFRRPPAPERARAAGFASGAGGSRRRYCAAILLHCASAACLTEAIGIFAAPVRQACFALLSAVFTFALLVVI